LRTQFAKQLWTRNAIRETRIVMAYWNRLGATVTRVDDQNVAMKTAKVGSGNQPCWAPTND
jgi:hypothetical protein